MAQQVTVTLIDDIDGSTDDVQSVEFSWEGQAYQIDLGAKNRQVLKETMDEYTPHAQKVSGGKPSKGRKTSGGKTPSASVDKEQSKAIRDWARGNGWPELGNRGRIPTEVLEAYNAKAGRPTTEDVAA